MFAEVCMSTPTVTGKSIHRILGGGRHRRNSRLRSRSKNTDGSKRAYDVALAAVSKSISGRCRRLMKINASTTATKITPDVALGNVNYRPHFIQVRGQSYQNMFYIIFRWIFTAEHRGNSDPHHHGNFTLWLSDYQYPLASRSRSSDTSASDQIPHHYAHQENWIDLRLQVTCAWAYIHWISSSFSI